MQNRRLAIAAAACVGMAVIGGAYWLGTTQISDRTPAATSDSAATHASQQPPADSSGPTDVARSWFTAQNTLRSTDSAAGAWVDRVRPLSTPSMRDTLEQYRSASGGVTWMDFQQQQCNRSVNNVRVRTSPESPQSENSKWVLVYGTAVTRCAQSVPQPPFPEREEVSTTLNVTRTPSGEWLVNDRIDAG